MARLRILLLLTILIAAFAGGSLVNGQKARSRSGVKPKPRVITAVVRETATPPEVKLAVEKQRRLDAFTKVWSTLNYNYFDRTFGGLNWTEVRDQYLPLVKNAKTDAEVHEIILDMVNRLNKSHFGLVPPEYYAKLRAARSESRSRERANSTAQADKHNAEDSDADGDDDATDLLDDSTPARFGVGVSTRVLAGRFVITSVDPGSSAADAGIKPGFVLDKINGVSMTDLVGKMSSSLAHVRHFERYLPFLVNGWILSSDHDTAVQLTCLDGADEPKVFDLKRKRLTGESVWLGNSMPAMYFEYESHPIGTDIGYVKFNAFAWQILGKFCDSLTQFADKRVIIIDLRGNVGGLIYAMQGLASMLSDKEVTLGTTVYRSGPTELTMTPKRKNFTGRLIFLVDDQSMSASEMLTAGLHDSGRALLVGQKTAGEALPAVTIKLATGAVFLYPIANYIAPAGEVVEGTGVEPDVSIPLDRTILLTGGDPQLERAVALAHDDAAFERLAERRSAFLESKTLAVKTAAKSDTDGPPPPPMPKPVPKSISASSTAKSTDLKLQALGRGSGLTSSPPTIGVVPIKGMDPRAVKILSQFAAQVGGSQAPQTYEVAGKLRISIGPDAVEMKYRNIRGGPDKFAIIADSGAVGEIREIHNGPTAFVESDSGIADSIKTDQLSPNENFFKAFFEVLSPGYFKALKYEGEYESEGERMQVIDGTTKDGSSVALTFDPATGTLSRFAVTGYGSTISYGDYRKVGDLFLPFSTSFGGNVTIDLYSLKVNEPIDPAIFEKKESCFDKPNK